MATTNKGWAYISIALILTLPALLFRFTPMHLTPAEELMIFGLGIIASTFLLIWASEVAEIDIPQSLALAFVALVAVLPEYAVDMFFSWSAGSDPQSLYGQYATANMTGANRLLIGFGWPLVVIIFWLKEHSAIDLGDKISLELTCLLIATIYALTIPLTHNIGLWDAGVLIVIFAIYIFIASKGKRPEVHTIGPAKVIGDLPTVFRRLSTIIIFGISAFIIFICAEPFALSLLGLGREVGIDEFFMVQWVGPLASEAPEILIAVTFTLRGHAKQAMITIISSKINQWTLLIGTIPIVYAVSSSVSGLGVQIGLPLDDRQSYELFLTAGQSLLAIVMIARWRISWLHASALFILWSTQIVLSSWNSTEIYFVGYMILSVVILAADKERFKNVVHMLSLKRLRIEL